MIRKILRSENIQIRMSVILIAVTTAILGIFAVYNYIQTRNTLIADLSKLSVTTTERIAKNLVNPLWNMEDGQIDDLQHSEMSEKQLYAIIIRTPNGNAIAYGKIRNETWKPVNIPKDIANISENCITRKQKVVKGEKTLGIVETCFTTRFMNEALHHYIVTTVVTLMLLNASILLALIISLRKFLIRPVHKFAADLNQGAEQVALASSDVSRTSHSMAEGASEQAASVEETSASVQQMAAVTQLNANNSVEADKLMTSVNQKVEQANQAMTELTESMDDISHASQETSKIIKTIDEIAFQTNLLALNAAVEAARAGEAGAGFAVVAEEVRNLAMRSAEAARNTAHLIQGTVDKVSDGNQLVSRSNEAFSEVADTARKVGHLVGEISTAARDQSNGIQQINDAVGNIDIVVQATAASAEEAASASEVLNSQAEIVKHTVEKLVALVGISSDIEVDASGKDIE